MKKLVFVCCALVLMSITTACEKEGNNTSSGNEPITTTSASISSAEKTTPLPTYDKAEYEPIAQTWKTRAESILQADAIDKVEYACYDTGEYEVFSSQDSTLIARWQVLIPKFRLTVVPYEPIFGVPPGTLTFYKGEDSIPLLVGHTILHSIQLEMGHPDAMLRVDNADEVGEEFTALLIEMGVPSPYIEN